MINFMITEDYVSFETAKLLKEKGFEEECVYFYDWDEEDEIYRICSNGGSCNSKEYPTYFSMPTLQMAMKWLREIYHIAIVVAPSMFWGRYNISIYKKGNDYPYGFDGGDLVPSYEQACEAAIKYCLENLI